MRRPPWTFVGDTFELRLTTWSGAVEGSEPLDPRRAVELLRHAIGPRRSRGDARGALEEVARHVLSLYPPRASVRHRGAREVVLDALARGVLVAWREDRHTRAPFSEGPSIEGEPAHLEGGAQRRTWIEIELTDMEGVPMRGERYWIKLPDGTVREGALDAQGRAYFGNLDPGSAEVRWPDRDGDATTDEPPLGQRGTRAGSSSSTEGSRAPDRAWIEIELLDMEGAAVPHERYWIELPNGTVREGVLDARGRAYFGDLDPGQCNIRWPARDGEATLLDLDATAPSPRNDVAAQVKALADAAREGLPFCEECERARQQQQQQQQQRAEAVAHG